MSSTLTMDDCKSITNNFLVTTAYIKQELKALIEGEFDPSKLHTLQEEIREISGYMNINIGHISRTIMDLREDLKAKHDTEGLRDLGNNIEQLTIAMTTGNAILSEIHEMIINLSTRN